MSEITHRQDETGRLIQLVSAARLREILDADGSNHTRPEDFGPDDEWDVGEQRATLDDLTAEAQDDGEY